jgi:hypothetical protein
MQRKEPQLLYPRNQAFIDGKAKQPANSKEIIHNITQMEISFMTPNGVFFFAAIGAISFMGCIAVGVQMFIASGDPDMLHLLNPFNPGVRIRENWLIGGFVMLFILGTFGVANIRWAFNAYPYLKYPTSAERHFRLLVDRGTTFIGEVKEVRPIDDRFVRVEYSTKKRREFGKWDTVSPIAKGLQARDRVYVFKQGDQEVLL